MTGELSFKPVVWVGSSRKDLRNFPDAVQDHIGYALYVAQEGGKHGAQKHWPASAGLGLWKSSRIIAAIRSAPFTRDIRVLFMCCTPFRKKIEDRTGNVTARY